MAQKGDWVTGTGVFRCLRGGSWNNDNPEYFRSAFRNDNRPDNRNHNNGFRVCWVVCAVSESFALQVPIKPDIGSAQERARPVRAKRTTARFPVRAASDGWLVASQRHGGGARLVGNERLAPLFWLRYWPKYSAKGERG